MPTAREEAIQDCIEWLRTHEGFMMHSGVAYRDVDGNVGLYAVTALRAGEILLVMPESAHFYVDNPRVDARLRGMFAAARDLYAAAYGEEARMLGLEVVQLQLLLLMQRDGSFWEKYVRTLPPDMSSIPVFWSDEELYNLRGTQAAAVISTIRSEVAENYTKVIQPALRSLAPELQAPFFALPPAEQEAAYRRAVAWLMSRAHDRRDGGAQLTPLVDLGNGLPDGWTDARQAVNVEFRDVAGCPWSTVSAMRDVAAGAELVISYGPVPLPGFVAMYGMVPDPSLRTADPFDCVHLMPPPALLPAPTDALRWRALDRYYEREEYTRSGDERAWLCTPVALRANELAAFRKGVESEDLRRLRQFCVLLLGDEDVLQRAVSTGPVRLRGSGCGASFPSKHCPPTTRWSNGVALLVVDLGGGELPQGNQPAFMKPPPCQGLCLKGGGHPPPLPTLFLQLYPKARLQPQYPPRFSNRQ